MYMQLMHNINILLYDLCPVKWNVTNNVNFKICNLPLVHMFNMELLSENRAWLYLSKPLVIMGILPLLCLTALSSLLRWIEKVNLKVRASCGHPPELKGRRVKDVHVFKSCPGERPHPNEPPKGPRAPKPVQPKAAHVQATVVKLRHSGGQRFSVSKSTAKKKKSL